MKYRNNAKDQPDLDTNKIPRHIAIIMDGNGRWARKRKLNRVNGHNKGADTVRSVVRTARELGVSYLTLYAFSTENWDRPKTEVAALMKLLKRFLQSEQQEMLDNDIRLQAIGELYRLPEDVLKELQQTMAITCKNKGMVLNLALSYGGRSEIVTAVKEIAEEVANQKLNAADISSDLISNHLFTKDMPDPDLVIRTSGEMRISNFLLWQIAYSELFITDTLWPDFTKEEFLNIIKDFQERDRRFGKIPSE